MAGSTKYLYFNVQKNVIWIVFSLLLVTKLAGRSHLGADSESPVAECCQTFIWSSVKESVCVETVKFCDFPTGCRMTLTSKLSIKQIEISYVIGNLHFSETSYNFQESGPQPRSFLDNLKTVPIFTWWSRYMQVQCPRLVVGRYTVRISAGLSSILRNFLTLSNRMRVVSTFKQTMAAAFRTLYLFTVHNHLSNSFQGNAHISSTVELTNELRGAESFLWS
jgi:hypothetical protein